MDSLLPILRNLEVDHVHDLVANPLDFYRSHLAKLISSLTGVVPSAILPAIQTSPVLKADLMLAVPALRLKNHKPEDLARKIQDEFPDTPLFERPEADRTFIKFFFKPTELAFVVLSLIMENPKDYGRNVTAGLKDPADPSRGKKRIVIDFGSPNIAKPFHVGHLRSTIIGGFIANLYEQANWDVVRLNYLGDWGKQYGVLWVGFNEFGSHEELTGDPIRHLFDVYVKISKISREEKKIIHEKEAKILELEEKGEPASALKEEAQQLRNSSVDERARQYFKRMCDGDEEALSLWKTFRELSIERYTATFARLNIQYDVYDGESQVKASGIEEALKILGEKGLTEESDGAMIVNLEKYSKRLGKAIVRKKDSTSIYLVRDIAAVFQRYDAYGYDKMIYVIANEQDLHMMRLIKIVELVGKVDLANRLQHINFGLVQKMRTRSGDVEFLDEVLDDAAEKMHQVMQKNDSKYAQVEEPEKTADILGISAVLIQDMSSKRINGYTYDVDRMTSFEGDTGPYLQYSHARLCSIIRKSEISLSEIKKAEYSLLKEEHAIVIVRRLVQWPDVFKRTFETKEPVTVVTYLFKLTHEVNSSYEHLNVLKSDREVKLARLALYVSAQTVLCDGLKLLGLTPLERM